MNPMSTGLPIVAGLFMIGHAVGFPKPRGIVKTAQLAAGALFVVDGVSRSATGQSVANRLGTIPFDAGQPSLSVGGFQP